MTECGSRPTLASSASSRYKVAPGRHTTWRPSSMRSIRPRRSVFDDHDGAVVVVAVRRRAAGQPGVRGLHDDDEPAFDADPQRLPLLNQRAGQGDDQSAAGSGPKSSTKSRRPAIPGQHVPPPQRGGEGPHDALPIANPRRVPVHAIGHRSSPLVEVLPRHNGPHRSLYNVLPVFRDVHQRHAVGDAAEQSTPTKVPQIVPLPP